jgi:hypothetical protein
VFHLFLANDRNSVIGIKNQITNPIGSIHLCLKWDAMNESQYQYMNVAKKEMDVTLGVAVQNGSNLMHQTMQKALDYFFKGAGCCGSSTHRSP